MNNEGKFRIKRRYRLDETTEPDENVISEYDRGMQRMVINMISSYMLSDEAEKLGIVGFQIEKEYTDTGVKLNSSFVIDEHIKDKNKYDEAFYKMFEDATNTLNELFEEVANNGKSKRKRRKE